MKKTAVEQCRDEVAVVIRRWALESDITVGDLLLAMHDAYELVIHNENEDDEDSDDEDEDEDENLFDTTIF
jgi:hypothetical protein